MGKMIYVVITAWKVLSPGLYFGNAYNAEAVLDFPNPR